MMLLYDLFQGRLQNFPKLFLWLYTQAVRMPWLNLSLEDSISLYRKKEEKHKSAGQKEKNDVEAHLIDFVLFYLLISAMPLIWSWHTRL